MKNNLLFPIAFFSVFLWLTFQTSLQEDLNSIQSNFSIQSSIRKLQNPLTSELLLTSGTLWSSPLVSPYTYGFVAVLTATHSITLLENVYAQMYDINALANGTSFLVNEDDLTYNHLYPSIANLEDGGFMIVWICRYNDSSLSFRTNLAQRFDKNGAKMGLSYNLTSDPSFFNNGDENNIVLNVAGLKNGGYVFAWRTYNLVYASVYYANGTAETSCLCRKIYTLPIGSICQPIILGLRNGNFVIYFPVFSMSLPDYYSLTVFQFTQNGIVSLDEIVLNYEDYMDLAATITFNGFMLASDRSAGNYFDIHGQFFDFNGNKIGSDILLHSQPYFIPFLFLLNDGCIMMVFNYCLDYNIYALKFDPLGNTISSTFKINTMTLNQFEKFLGLVLSNGNFLISWNNVTNYPAFDFYGRIFSPGVNPFRVISDNITINQGQTLQIDNSMIFSIGNGTINYNVVGLRNGNFSIANISITHFTQSDIDNSLLFFIHDGSLSPPLYSLEITNSGSTITSYGEITFIQAPYFLNNYIEMEQNSNIVITNLMIEGVNFDGSQIGYTIISNLSCYFELNSNPGVSITEFTPDQVNNLEVTFTSLNPSYVLSMNSGSGSVAASSNINYNISLILITNKMTIKQGQSFLIDSTIFQVESNSSLLVTYFVSYVQNGFFALSTNLNDDVLSFSEDDIQNSNVYFIHDGSYKAPKIAISVTNAKVISSSSNTQINFISNINLINNNLNIMKGESLMITSDLLSAISIQGMNIIFAITDLLHGQFFVSNQSMTQFTKQNILDFMVFFSHDDSQNSPSYKVSVGDGSQFSDPFEALISFNNLSSSPILLNNYFIINQGQILTLSNDNLYAFDGGINFQFSFEIINIQNSYFAYSDNLKIPITTFSSDDVNNSNIVFIPDGSTNTPQFNISVSTFSGILNKNEYSANIYFNTQPILITNTLIIKKGEKKAINSEILQGIDKETDFNNLWFIVSNVVNRFFALQAYSTQPITAFYQSQIANAEVLFIHDGSNNAPSYSVSIYDGAIKIIPQQAYIEFFLMMGICGLAKGATIEGYLMGSIGFTFDNNFIIASLNKGLIMIININDPEITTLENTLDLSQFNITNIGSLLVKNNYTYVVSETNALITISLEDLTNPKFIGSIGNNSSGYDLAICENQYMYVGTESGIFIISLENQESPYIVLIFSVNGSSVPLLTCFNDYLYVVTEEENSKMYIYDVYDATNPQLKSNVALSSNANFIKVSSKGKLVFVATNVGIDIFDISNPYNIANVTSIPLSNEAFSLDLSSDEEYLIVLCDMIVFAINIQIINDYTILDSLTYEIGLNQIILLPNSQYGFIASSEGLQIFNMFNGLQSRLSPYLSSISPNYQNATTDTNAKVSVDGNFYFIITMINNWQFFVIKDASNLANYNTTLQEINLTCNSMDLSQILVSKNDQKTVYVTTCGNLTTISVIPILIANIKTSIFLDGAWGLAFSPKEDFIYVTNCKLNQESNHLLRSLDHLDKDFQNFGRIFRGIP